MSKRNGRRQSYPCIPPRRTHDPWVDIVVRATNRVVEFGTDYLLDLGQKKLGIKIHSMEKQIELNRSLCALEKNKLEVAIVKQKEVEALEHVEQTKLKNEQQKNINEKKAKLLDLEVEEKEHRIELLKERSLSEQDDKYRQSVHIRVEPLSGRLAVVATKDGLTAASTQIEACTEWLENSKEGHVLMVLGRRGSGKTAFTLKFAEFLRAAFGTPAFWIGLPSEAQDLLPSWFHITDAVEACPSNSFIMCDETGLNYLSLLFNTQKNRYLHWLMMIARHKRTSLAFAAHSSRDIDCSIMRQADSIIFKEPGLNQAASERPDIRQKAKKAALVFKQMPRQERVGAAYVFSDRFEGTVHASLPSFWTPELSYVYRDLDLKQIDTRSGSQHWIRTINDTEIKTLDSAHLDSQILDLKQQGYGIEKIARILNCTTWAVRKYLDSM